MPSFIIKRRIFEPALTVLLLLVMVFAVHIPPVAAVDVGVDQLNQQILGKKNQIKEIQTQISAYQKTIAAKRLETATIENELEIVANRIAKDELDIRLNELEIDATSLELKQLDEQIQEKSLKMMHQRELVGEYLRAIHKTDQRTSIDLFLTEKTLSDFFNDVQFLNESQRDLQKALDNVIALKTELEQRQDEAATKKTHLEEIQTQLARDKDELNEQLIAKSVLADQSRMAELRTRYQLAQLQKEIQNINNEIASSETKIRKTLDLQKLQRLEGDTTGWGWPVNPSRGISAYFHDPDYPFRYIFEHPAIDIRAAQGTAIRAPKAGYVGRAKDAGMGYSYVMLIHEDGMSTVYGHVSKIFVKEDAYVEKGDIIAYSGATPGTPGAGSYTTGPHLHLEFRLNGIPVNALDYLQL